MYSVHVRSDMSVYILCSLAIYCSNKINYVYSILLNYIHVYTHYSCVTTVRYGMVVYSVYVTKLQ